MIKMICGSTYAENELKTPDSLPFSLSENAEARLVALKVARYTDNQKGHTDFFAESGENHENGQMATDENENNTEEKIHNTEDVPEYDLSSSVADLRAIAKAHGITFASGIIKMDMIAVLDEHFGKNDEPELTVSAPV